MNIIIFDKEHNCHQFEADKRWASKFISNPLFFSNSEKELSQYITATLSSDKEIYAETIKCASLTSHDNLDKIDFTISSDYGIALIDFQEKVVLTINDYSSLNKIYTSEYSLAFLNAELDAMIKYKSLLERGYFIGEDGTTEKTLRIFNNLIEENRLNYKPGQVKIINDFSDRAALVASPKCGWVIKATSEAQLFLVPKFLVHIMNKKISMTSTQESDWLDSYKNLIEKLPLYSISKNKIKKNVEEFRNFISSNSQKNQLEKEVAVKLTTPALQKI